MASWFVILLSMGIIFTQASPSLLAHHFFENDQETNENNIMQQWMQKLVQNWKMIGKIAKRELPPPPKSKAKLLCPTLEKTNFDWIHHKQIGLWQAWKLCKIDSCLELKIEFQVCLSNVLFFSEKKNSWSSSASHLFRHVLLMRREYSMKKKVFADKQEYCYSSFKPILTWRVIDFLKNGTGIIKYLFQFIPFMFKSYLTISFSCSFSG